MLKLFKERHKTQMLEKTNVEAKTIVIELYSPDEINPDNIKHELLANYEIGEGLRKKYQQNTRFLYALNDPIIESIKGTAAINLADEHGLEIFAKQIKDGDSLIIIAQGDMLTQTVAGYNAEELVEILQLDLELRNLHRVELFAARMGYCEEFRETVSNLLDFAQEFVTYKGIPTANHQGICVFVEVSDTSDNDGNGFEKTLRPIDNEQLDDSIVIKDRPTLPSLNL